MTLTLEEVCRRLKASPPPGRRHAPGADGRPMIDKPRGDHDLNPDFFPPGKPPRAAAVLVPLVNHAEGLSVLLTQRTDHLEAHAGQISFPGGRIDPEDESAEDAALREAQEEISLPRSAVQLIARLDTYLTRTGFEVTPVVGVVTPPLDLKPDPFEVAEIFEVPLAFFLQAESRQLMSRVYQGKERHFYAYPYGERFIWGATAGMLNDLVERLLGGKV